MSFEFQTQEFIEPSQVPLGYEHCHVSFDKVHCKTGRQLFILKVMNCIQMV